MSPMYPNIAKLDTTLQHVAFCQVTNLLRFQPGRREFPFWNKCVYSVGVVGVRKCKMNVCLFYADPRSAPISPKQNQTTVNERGKIKCLGSAALHLALYNMHRTSVPAPVVQLMHVCHNTWSGGCYVFHVFSKVFSGKLTSYLAIWNRSGI